jgi:ketosteroid isomerase-like protein
MARLNGRVLNREPVFDSSSQSKKDPMKKSSVWCVLGVVLLTSCAWAQIKSANETEKAIFALEHQWLKSQQTNNVDLMVPLLADKFVETSSDGKVTNTKETLATAKATKWDSVDYQEMKVTTFGDAAVAIGLFVAKGTDDKGKALDLHERFTDTWVKMANGKWQCVASHASPLK